MWGSVNNYDNFYLFVKFYVIMCLTRTLKRSERQRTVFCHDVFNTHGFDCTRMYMRTFFLKYDYSFGALIWKASKTYNSVKFCTEAKTIIVVNMYMVKLFKVSSFRFSGVMKLWLICKTFVQLFQRFSLNFPFKLLEIFIDAGNLSLNR